MWTGVGSWLLVVGVRWMQAADTPRIALAIAVMLGLLKLRLALIRTAGRTIDRICDRGDGRCIGGFLSWRSWLVVLLMAGVGRLLRGSDLPMNVVAFVYVVVGAALLPASVALWRAWYQRIRSDAADT
jgi:hypothetical protein